MLIDPVSANKIQQYQEAGLTFKQGYDLLSPGEQSLLRKNMSRQQLANFFDWQESPDQEAYFERGLKLAHSFDDPQKALYVLAVLRKKTPGHQLELSHKIDHAWNSLHPHGVLSAQDTFQSFAKTFLQELLDPIHLSGFLFARAAFLKAQGKVLTSLKRWRLPYLQGKNAWLMAGSIASVAEISAFSGVDLLRQNLAGHSLSTQSLKTAWLRSAMTLLPLKGSFALGHKLLPRAPAALSFMAIGTPAMMLSQEVQSQSGLSPKLRTQKNFIHSLVGQIHFGLSVLLLKKAGLMNPPLRQEKWHLPELRLSQLKPAFALAGENPMLMSEALNVYSGSLRTPARQLARSFIRGELGKFYRIGNQSTWSGLEIELGPKMRVLAHDNLLRKNPKIYLDQDEGNSEVLFNGKKISGSYIEVPFGSHRIDYQGKVYQLLNMKIGFEYRGVSLREMSSEFKLTSDRGASWSPFTLKSRQGREFSYELNVTPALDALFNGKKTVSIARREGEEIQITVSEYNAKGLPSNDWEAQPVSPAIRFKITEGDRGGFGIISMGPHEVNLHTIYTQGRAGKNMKPGLGKIFFHWLDHQRLLSGRALNVMAIINVDIFDMLQWLRPDFLAEAKVESYLPGNGEDSFPIFIKGENLGEKGTQYFQRELLGDPEILWNVYIPAIKK